MEIYILDSLLRPVDVIDTFISLVWTERFSTLGDFEMDIIATPANLQRLSGNVWLMKSGSNKMMRIESVETKIGSDHSTVMKIKGRDVLSITEARTALHAVSGLIESPVWYITDMTPADIIRYMFNQICVVGTVSPLDIIPYYHTGTLYPASTIPEPPDLIDWEQKPASLYAAMKEIGDIYDLGMRMYKDPNTSDVYFNVYSGSDRTTGQTVLAPIVFSADMENLFNTTEFTSVAQAYNTALVLHTYHDSVTDTDVADGVVVYDDFAPITDGFTRRVKMVSVTNIPEEVTDISAFLVQAGKDELKKSRPITAFDGEISQISNYRYEVDYYLGDLVEMRGASGSTSYMRVEEYISVQDSSGERSYPTFTTKQFIESGTWFSWEYNRTWDSMPDSETWSNQ